MTKLVEIGQAGRTVVAPGGEKAQGLIPACRAIPATDAIVTWLDGDDETPSHPRRRLNCRVAAIADATHDIKRTQLVIDGSGMSLMAALSTVQRRTDRPMRRTVSMRAGAVASIDRAGHSIAACRVT